MRSTAPNKPETSPERLMASFQDRGDAEAFEQIVSRFLAPALAAAHEVLSDHALAEDAVQEAFLRVVRWRDRYLPAKPFSSWFYAILRNLCTDMLRRRARRAKLMQAVADRGGAPSGRVPDGPSDSLDLLAGLPRGERAVLTLRIVHDLAFRDVAAALGISEEAAKKRAQRGLRRLREQSYVSQAPRRAAALPGARRAAEEDAVA